MYKSLAEIAGALARIKDPSLIEGFLGQLLTKSEMKRIVLRWKLSKDLCRGKSQRRIAEDLGVSLCKITRGSREMKKEKSALKRVIEESLNSGPKEGRFYTQ
ncbi:MAG: transcriptional regulator [Spirochaetales bacterium]|nr:transcriptional regulator [Spirochaetales bacterium]